MMRPFMREFAGVLRQVRDEYTGAGLVAKLDGFAASLRRCPARSPYVARYGPTGHVVMEWGDGWQCERNRHKDTDHRATKRQWDGGVLTIHWTDSGIAQVTFDGPLS